MAKKLKVGDMLLLRVDVSRVDDDDETVTVTIPGLTTIRHTLRQDSEAIEDVVSMPRPGRG